MRTNDIDYEAEIRRIIEPENLDDRADLKKEVSDLVGTLARTAARAIKEIEDATGDAPETMIKRLTE